jgi:hypothetical protein
VQRVKAEPRRDPHALLGDLTCEESDTFLFRHVEMHGSCNVE